MARWSWALALLLVLVASIPAVRSDPESTSGPDEGIEEVGVVEEVMADADLIESAEGIDTVYHFPNNPKRVVPAGEPVEILVGINNNGQYPINVNLIRASIHLPFDHKLLVQNLTSQGFVNATVPVGVQATFSYPFTVSKFLQPGSFQLEASVFYDSGEDVFKNVFYNGTVEVVESGGFVSGETLFLVTLGLGLIGLFGMWIHGQVHRLSKTRRTKVVETGTRNAEAINNEWLQGTAFMQKPKAPQPAKIKKKK